MLEILGAHSPPLPSFVLGGKQGQGRSAMAGAGDPILLRHESSSFPPSDGSSEPQLSAFVRLVIARLHPNACHHPALPGLATATEPDPVASH